VVAAISNRANIITASQVDIAELNYLDAVTKYTPNSPTLMQKKEQVILAQKQLKKDSIDYARNKRLFKANAISALDLENSEIQYQTSHSNYIVQKNSLAETLEDLNLTRRSTQKQLDIQKQSDAYNDLVSGIKGTLAELNLNEGDLVTTGTVIAKITGGKPKAKLYIDETDINRVKLEQKVLVSLNTRADTSIEARVTRIYPSFDITDQAFVAEADFTNPPPGIYLFTQTQLQANIIIGTHKHALIIPTNCIVKNTVQVKGEKEPRQVKTGIVNGTWTEILSGISDNDKLVVPKKK
jgi:multidrug efflux pump subunit AcrA (membrane-fusion protein)